MTNEELMNYAKGRIKTYTFHKLNVFDATTKEKFEECAAELLSDIREDTKMLMDIEKSGFAVPKAVVQQFASLSSFYDNIMEFYCKYKNLKGF